VAQFTKLPCIRGNEMMVEAGSSNLTSAIQYWNFYYNYFLVDKSYFLFNKLLYSIYARLESSE